jgi:hypothetical protein
LVATANPTAIGSRIQRRLLGRYDTTTPVVKIATSENVRRESTVAKCASRMAPGANVRQSAAISEPGAPQMTDAARKRSGGVNALVRAETALRKSTVPDGVRAIRLPDRR